MLVISPRFDKATEYSFKWVKRLLKELNMPYDALFEKDATRENAEKLIPKHELIVFYDHGDKNGLLAQGGATYVIDKKNDKILKGKVVYTMACLWGSDGGIDAWKKGAKVVWAYTDVFGFTNYDEELFCECANYGLIIYNKENITWEEALKRAKEKFDEAIKKAKDGWTKIWLRHDRDALVCYTENNPPETSTCPLRRFLIQILGAKRAWKLTSKIATGLFSSLIGWGITIHAIANELYYKGGYAEILKPQGEWIGLALNLIGIILLSWEYIKILKS